MIAKKIIQSYGVWMYLKMQRVAYKIAKRIAIISPSALFGGSLYISELVFGCNVSSYKLDICNIPILLQCDHTLDSDAQTDGLGLRTLGDFCS